MIGVDAVRLESELQDTAARLGLRVKVTYDTDNLCFFIDCGLRQPPRANYSIDEEMFVAQPSGSTVIADFLQRVLEDLQRRTYDAMREQLDRLDVRGRIVQLSKEDKHTLHDMYMGACDEALRDFHRAEAGVAKVDKYQELIGRLFR